MTTKPTLRLDLPSDSGRSDSDRITSETRPIFEGTADPGALLQLFRDGVLAGQVVANAEGKFSLQVAAEVPDGNFNFTARATLAGVSSLPSDAVLLAVDTAAPVNTTIALSSASDTAVIGDFITADLTPTLSGKAESGSIVTITRAGTFVGQTQSVDGQWTFTPLINQPEGSAKFSAIATDAAGNSDANPPVISLLLDATPPRVPDFGLSVASDSGLLGDLRTRIVRPTFTGVAEDGSLLALLEGTALIGRGDTNGGVWTATLLGDLSEGEHIITARSSDLAGNLSESRRTITIDRSTPQATITLLAASDSGVVGDNVTSQTRPFLSGTAEAGATVTIRDGASVIASATTGADGTWTVLPPALAEGPHALTAQARDTAGNLGLASAVLNLVIDSIAPIAPAATLTADSDSGVFGDLRTNDQTPSITGVTEPGATLVVKLGAAELARVIAGADGTWRFDDVVMRPTGAVNYDLVAIDRAGNASAGARTAVRIDFSPPNAPRLFLDDASDTGRSTADHITADATPTFNGTTEANANVTLFRDGEKLETITANGAGFWAFTTGFTSEGTHVFEARAQDVAGNNSLAASTLAVTFDYSPPATPTLALVATSDSGRSASDRITSDTTPTLTGLAEPFAAIEIFDGATQLGQVAADALGAFTFTPTTALADGVRFLGTVSIDAAGNRSLAATLTVTIDTRPETVIADLFASSDSGVSSTDNITQDTTPTIDFSQSSVLTAGDTLEVLQDGIAAGTITFAVGQPFSFTPIAALADGVHAVSGVLTDAAGNRSAAGAISFTIDTARPLAPTIALAAASDSGRSLSDRITNDTTPTVSGLAEPNATVVIRSGTAEVGRGTVDATGAYTITTVPNAPGDTTLSATAIDRAGNEGPAASVSITIDTTAPTAPTIDMTTDTGFSTTDDITRTALARFVGTAEAGADVSIFDGTTLLGTVRATATGTYALNLTTALADGAHTIRAIATDAAGNASAVASLPIVIDTTAPLVTSFDIAAASDSGRSDTDNITNSSAPIWLGTAEPGSLVELFIGATRLPLVPNADVDSSTGFDRAIVRADGSWTARESVGIGSGTYTAKAVDIAGNIGPALPLTLTIDRERPSAPTVSLDVNSDTGRFNNDSITSDNTPTFSGTAEPDALIRIGLQIPLGASLPTVLTDAAGNWSFTVPANLALREGRSLLQFQGFDIAGNPSDPTIFPIAIDRTIPSISIQLDPASDSGTSSSDRLTNDASPTFTGTTDPDALVELRFTRGALSILDATANADSTGNWSFTPPTTLADGTYTVQSQVTDLAGNRSALPDGTLTFTLDTAITTPTISLQAASDTGERTNDRITSDATPTLRVTGAPGDAIRILDGTVTVANLTLPANATEALVTLPVLATGAHSLRAQASDAAGNVSALSATLDVTIDVTAPTAPTLDLVTASDTGRSSTDNLTSDTTPTLAGLAGTGTSIVRVFEGGTLIGTSSVDTARNWSLTPAVQTGGVHTYSAIGFDLAGNQSAPSQLVVTIDAIAPAAPSIDLAASSDSGSSSVDNITKLTSIRLTGSAETGSFVTIKEGSVQLGSVTTVADGTWSFVVRNLADGPHGFTAEASDAAGNTGPVSPALGVTIDTVGPTATISLVSSSDTGSSSSDNLTSDTTPTFLGFTEPGASVLIIRGATNVGTTTANNLGIWSFTPTLVQPQGPSSYTVIATDLAGNAGPRSAAVDIVIDSVGPTTTLSLGLGSDTGRSSTDRITNDATPTLVGVTEAGARVEIRDGAIVIGAVTADTNGIWTFTTATLPAGIHPLSARATDAAGNTGAPTTIGVNIDTKAPGAVTIDLANTSDTGRSEIDNVTKDATPTFTGTAEAGATVELLVSGTIVATTTASSTGAWSATTSLLSDGVRTVNASARDAAGNVGPSASLAVTIDTVAPRSADLSLNNLSNTGSRVDATTGDVTPTIRILSNGTASDTLDVTATPQGQAGVVLVRGSAAGIDVNRTLANQPSGTTVVTAKTEDVAGNIATETLSVVINRITPSGPTIDLAASSDSGIFSDDRETSDATPTFVGAARPGSTVTLLVNGVALGTTTADSDSNWSFTLGTPLFDGNYLVEAADGTARNHLIGLTVDTIAPVAPTNLRLSVSSDEGFLGDFSTPDRRPVVVVDTIVVDTIRDLSVIDYQLVVNGAVRADNDVISPAGIALRPLVDLPDGNFEVSVRGVDRAGNVGALATTRTLEVDTRSLVLDPASDTGTVGDGITSLDRPTFVTSAVAGTTVRFSADGAEIGSAIAAGDGSVRFTPASPLAAGRFGISAREADGTPVAAGKILPIEIDRSGPAPVKIALDALSDTGLQGDNVTSDPRPTLRFFAGEDVSEIEILRGSTVVATIPVNDGTSTFTFPANLAIGTQNITAIGIDAAGNRGLPSPVLPLVIISVPTAPTISVLGAQVIVPGDRVDLVTTDFTPTLSGAARPGASLQIFDGPSVIGSAIADSRGQWTFTTPATITGEHSYLAADGGVQSQTFRVSIIPAAVQPFTIGLAPGFDLGLAGDGRTSISTPRIGGTASPFAFVSGQASDSVTNRPFGFFNARANEQGEWSASIVFTSIGSLTWRVSGSGSGPLGAGSAAADIVVGARPITVQLSASDVTFIGTAPAGAIVVVLVDGDEIGRIAAGTDGRWSLSTAQPANGTHLVRATTINGTLLTPDAEVQFVVDTIAPTAPTIALAPEENSGSAAAPVSLQPTPSFIGTGEPGTTVRIATTAGQTVGSALVGKDGNWRFDLETPHPSGVLNLVATASDGINTSATSAVLTLTLGTGNPSSPIIGVEQQSGAELGFVRDTRPVFEGFDGRRDAIVTIFDGAVAVGSARTDMDGRFSTELLVPLDEGLHLITARIGTSASPAIRVTVDNAPPTAPTFTLLPSSDTGVAGDFRTSDSSPTVAGTTEPFASIHVIDARTNIEYGSGKADASGAFAFSLTALLPAGRYDLGAFAIDRAGNAGPVSVLLPIVIEAIEGDARPNALSGTLSIDTLLGHGGNDTLDGLGSNDMLAGGLGDDTLTGGPGADDLRGGLGNDTASYETSSEGVTVSLVRGSATGGDATGDQLSGIENLKGSAEADALAGDGGSNRLEGGGSNDMLEGLDGNDTLAGGGGDDRLEGGIGNDVYVISGEGTDTIFDAGGTTDTLELGSLDSILASTRVGTDLLITLTSGATLRILDHARFPNRVEFARDATRSVVLASGPIGGNASGIISGTDSNDRLDGAGGDDLLFAGAGDDTLIGGTGADLLAGGRGSDRYIVDSIGDVVFEIDVPGEIDFVWSSVSFKLGAFLETLTLVGHGAIDGTGNDLDNRIRGNVSANFLSGGVGNDTLRGDLGSDTLDGGAGKDTLDGGVGADAMFGGAGNDSYTVDDTGDLVGETDGLGNDAGGIDTVSSSVSWTLGAFVENLTLTGTAAINGTGNALANRITGNAAANVLDGMAGNDTLTGNAGANTLIGGEGDDALSGGGDADSLLGGAGNDRLDGGAGADAMFGGAGNDSYTVDDTGDRVDETDGRGNDAGGIDTVSSSASWTLGAFVENLTLTGTAAINGTGNALANRITGNAAANVLDGGDGNDTISGGVGADRLAGGFGLDSLSGGADADTFVFTSLFAGRDTITDFVSGIDILAFDDAGFAGLSSGATVSLAINSSLGSGIAGFTFNTSTKILAYDADGLGGLAATEIARLSTTTKLSSADFMII